MKAMKRHDGDACRAWQLLMRFFFTQRDHLPASGGEFELSPVQCHVLHLIEPGRPLPMGRLAATLSCDASNVTGLVDRLEARGLVARRPSTERPPGESDAAHARRVAAAVVAAQADDGQSQPLSRLSGRQQRALVSILEALVDEARDHRG